MPLSPDRQYELAERDRATGSNRGDGRTYGPAGSVTEQGRQATRNIESAVRDYNNEGNSFLDNLGNLAARSFGFAERDPLSDPNFDPYTQDQANYGFSPTGLIGGLAGLAVGLPGLGTAFSLGDELAGRPLEIPLGQSVFDPGATIRPDQRQSIAQALSAGRGFSNRV